MKLWILDDRKFPTGYANGGFERNPKHEKYILQSAIWTSWDRVRTELFW